MTKLMTMNWADFAVATAETPNFVDLLSNVLRDRGALHVQVDGEEITLSAHELAGQSGAVTLSGVWVTDPISDAEELPVCAQLCLPLIFRAQSILIPYDAFSTIATDGRTLASFSMRNILNAIFAGVEIRYETATIDPARFDRHGRDLAVVYQYLLANELDEPALKDRDFIDRAVMAMQFPMIEWESPLLAAGREALAVRLRQNMHGATVHHRFDKIRRDLFACIR